MWACGCNPRDIRLQPPLPTVAASVSYGCSPRHLRLQVEPLVFHFNVSLESAAAQLDVPIAPPHGQSAALVAPQLAALAAWGAALGCSRSIVAAQGV